MSASTRGHGGKPGKGGLGRGLGALIPSAPVVSPPVDSATSIALPADVAPDPDMAVEADDATTGPDATSAAEAPTGVPRETASDETPDDGSLRAVPGARMAEVAVADIRANASQPRSVFDDDALAELTHSIREFGVLQPVVVRPTSEGDTPYELVMGERRLRASIAAGLERIPAVVRETADDAMLRDALLENIHRAQLNPLEEAAAYQQLLEEFGATHEDLAHRIGRSRSQVTNTIRLMNLPVAVQRRVAAGVLSAGHARALLGLPDAAAQEALATRVVAEGMSVRATEEAVALALHDGPAKARKPGRTFTAPALGELAGKLSDVFDTRVKVDLGRRKGRITVEFATVDDLERIVSLMAPHLDPRREPGPTD
ncbi:ParB/RepB/Spo0J family partition protein [Jatrophihabitans sp. YIM 134969]